jgi:hypothetical protein
MGIDHIGKKGPSLPPSTEPSGGGRAAETGRPFEAPAPRASASAPGPLVSPTEARTPLERWRSGEIDLRGYLDLRVDQATAHLSGLPPSELEAIRSALRERMASDPALVDLVRTATGRTPEPPHED